MQPTRLNTIRDRRNPLWARLRSLQDAAGRALGGAALGSVVPGLRATCRTPGAAQRPPAGAAAPFESLEARQLLAAVAWTGAAGDLSWNNPLNWSNNALPTAADDVTLSLPASDPTVVIPSGAQSVRSLFSDEAITVQGGASLSVATTADLHAPLTLNGGALLGGAWTVTGGGGIVAGNSAANRLVGATIDGDITLSAAGAYLRIAGGLTLDGTLHLSGDGAGLGVEGTQTWRGNGTVSFEGATGGLRFLEAAASNTTLTLASTFTLSGGNAQTQGSRHFPTTGGFALINEGLIRADVPGQALAVNNKSASSPGGLQALGGTLSVGNLSGSVGAVSAAAGGTLSLAGPGYALQAGAAVGAGATATLNGSWSNAGTLAVAAGTLNLGGAFTTAALGTITRAPGAPGTVNLTGTLNNAGATLALGSAAAAGPWVLSGGTINGGTISTTDALGLTASDNSANRLADVTVLGDVTLSAANAYLRIAGSLTLHGTIHLSGDRAGLAVEGSQTWGGLGTVSFEGTAGVTRFLEPTANGLTLTLAPTFRLVGGRGQTQGTRYFLTSGFALVNQGLIRADVAGQTLSVNNSAFSNTGTLEAVGGTLALGALANLSAGTLTGGAYAARAGGTLRFPAAVTTLSATLAIDGPTSNVFAGTAGASALAGLASVAPAGRLQLAGGRTLAVAPAGGTFANGGVLHLGPGSSLTVVGGYAQAGTGRFETEIAGPTAGDVGRLAVAGPAALAGTLDVAFVNGYAPASADAFVVLTFTARSGQFDGIALPAVARGALMPLYRAADLLLDMNVGPDAADDSAALAEDGSAVLPILANDADPDEADPLTVVGLTQPAHGTAVLNPDGTVTYTPAPNYNGPDAFTYTLRDAAGNTDAATVWLAVAPVNDAPVLPPQSSWAVDEGATLAFTATAFDADGDALAWSLVGAPEGAAVDPDSGAVTFSAGAPGTYAFVLRAADTGQPALYADQVVTVRVDNVAPAAAITGAPALTVLPGTAVLLGSVVTDPGAADTFTFAWTVTLGDAVVATGAGAEFVFTPAATGTYTVTLVVTDAYGGASAPAVATVRAAASSLSGVVWVDANGNGAVDAGEDGLAGVTLHLSGTDDLGNPVSATAVTDDNGAYAFLNLRPGVYALAEDQPTGYSDAGAYAGTAGGTVDTSTGTGQVTGIALAPDQDGAGYNFADRRGRRVRRGQVATTAYWGSTAGESLLLSVNGGPSATRLGTWLGTNFPRLFGRAAGKAYDLTGKSNAQVVAAYRRRLDARGRKLEAQVLALAFSAYVTDAALAGSAAARYGFAVEAAGLGLGAATVDVGKAGAAFGVANHTALGVLDLLRAADRRAARGLLNLWSNALANRAGAVVATLAAGGGIR